MAELKTKPTNQNPKDFLNTIEPEEKRRDGFTLLEMFQKITGEIARMFKPTLIKYLYGLHG